MLREIETDRETDRVEPVGPQHKPEPDLKPIQWKRATKDNQLIRTLTDLSKLLGHAVLNQNRQIEKQLRKLEKF